jgi:hypothetical protein
MCDPFVHVTPGTTAFVLKLAGQRIPVFGVVPFPAAIAEAAARRFGWVEAGISITTVEREGQPLWSVAATAARRRGLLSGVFVTSDTWELASAVREGCALPIELRSMADGASSTASAATLGEAYAMIEEARATAPSGPRWRSSGTIDLRENERASVFGDRRSAETNDRNSRHGLA